MSPQIRHIGLAGVFLALLAAPGASQDAPVFEGFTFKKLKPPSSDTTKRINIQILTPWNPPPPPAPTTRAPGPAPAAPDSVTAPNPDGQTDWFWDVISPDMSAAGPGRFLAAIDHLAGSSLDQRGNGPRLQNLRGIADTHGLEILKATIGTRISPALVLAVIAVESGGRVTAESNKGAQGLMQLIPATAARFDVADSNDAAQNIKGGVAYLDWLLVEFGGDPILALAGYNAGENAVKNNGGVPPYAETRAYVPKVLAAWAVARTLCITPPELVTDGCVFLPTGTL